MNPWIDISILESDTIALLPLDASHQDALLTAAKDGILWELWYTSVPSSATINNYLDKALAEKENGQAYPFVVFHKKTKQIIGSTRYYNLQPEHRRLEIGYTWYAKSHQRTRVNTECKYLLLQYAFEIKHCIAVQFMTDWHNIASRNAIARLGAHQDGLLRNHRLNSDGSYRDSVVFSITENEWSGVKKNLTQKLLLQE
ncbi:MAG: GNAT family N-acetyltransferase [Flavobacteriales bacterium]|jgi:RimJ/RimL family protein N-acetyltransferase|nr:GNAT family N-acetyltransferase [Flavobacteriales bacterium]